MTSQFGSSEERAFSVQVTAYDLAERFIGLHETPGAISTPMVLAMLKLDASWPESDEIPWCSAFPNYINWLLRLPRSRSLAARSWLDVGWLVDRRDARVGMDVVVLKRGAGKQPGPEVRKAPGHVGYFAGFVSTKVMVLAGNQGNSVSVAPFPVSDILGIRRLVEVK